MEFFFKALITATTDIGLLDFVGEILWVFQIMSICEWGQCWEGVLSVNTVVYFSCFGQLWHAALRCICCLKLIKIRSGENMRCRSESCSMGST